MPQRSLDEYEQAIREYYPEGRNKEGMLREIALYLLKQPGHTALLSNVGVHLSQKQLKPRQLGLKGRLNHILSNTWPCILHVGREVNGYEAQRPVTLAIDELPERLFKPKQPSSPSSAAAGQQQQQQQHATATSHKRELVADEIEQVNQEAKRPKQHILYCPSLVLVKPEDSTAALDTAQTTVAADTGTRAEADFSATLAAAGAADQQAAASAVAHVQQQLTVSASSRDVERMRLMSSMFEFGTAMVKAGAAPDQVMQLLDEARGLIASSGSSSGGDLNRNGVSNGYRTLG